MTIFKDIVRVRDDSRQILNYVPKTGIEMVAKPYQDENNIFDVMFRTSDMNPCLSERLLMDDINTEVERLKFIYSDRMRDSQFKKDLKDGNKTFMRFRDFEDSDNLKNFEEFKSKAEVIYGDPNRTPVDANDEKIQDEYIKAKKKYLSLIDSG